MMCSFLGFSVDIPGVYLLIEEQVEVWTRSKRQTIWFVDENLLLC